MESDAEYLGIVLKYVVWNIISTLPMHRRIFDSVWYDIYLLQLGVHPVAVLVNLFVLFPFKLTGTYKHTIVIPDETTLAFFWQFF
jgi:hypothetical protein